MAEPGDIPALESGMGMGMGMGMSLPIGMTRRALSYDDNLEAPMSPPPSDISINNLWRRPVIPERRFQQLAEEDESGSAVTRTATFDAATPHIPVVKTKASSIIMNSLMTKQTHDSMYKFEQKVGLTDTSYTPHKGLTAEETRYHQRMPESFHKLNIQTQSADAKSDKSASSTQSTPSSTPQSSPKNKRRSWFNSQGSTASITSSDLSVGSNTSIDTSMGPVEGGGAMERWGVFGPRPLVQTSTSDLGAEPSTNTTGGFALQAYRGAQRPTPMEVMKAQATRLADDPASQKAPPKMEIPSTEGRRQGSRPHKLKPRDMNILTPSGF